MKSYLSGIFICILFYSAPLSAQETLLCSNGNFLDSNLYLEKVNGEWQFINLSTVCEMHIEEVVEPKPNYEGWLLLVPEVDQESQCLVKSKLLIQPFRLVKSLYLPPSVSENEPGRMRIELDNRPADHGPSTIKSFLYCR